MRNIIIIVGLLIVLVVAIFLASRLQTGSFIYPFSFGNSSLKTEQVKIDGKNFKLEVAETDEEKQIGLSSKNSLSANQGMIFKFTTPGIYTFWMKDMKFPIDIIFLNGNRIVTIHKDAQPLKDENNPEYFQPSEASDTVIELKAGTADDLGLKVGDEINTSN